MIGTLSSFHFSLAFNKYTLSCNKSTQTHIYGHSTCILTSNKHTISSRKCRWKEMKAAALSWFHLVCYICLTLSRPLSYARIDYSITTVSRRDRKVKQDSGGIFFFFGTNFKLTMQRFTNIRAHLRAGQVLPFSSTAGC